MGSHGIRDQVAIVGMGCTNFGEQWDQGLDDLILDARGGASQQELCTAARIDSGNMVELLDGLEALRYAQRARDPHDRRRYVVTITPAGRSALTDLRQAVDEYNERVLSPLTGREQRQLAATLAKLFATTAEGRGR